MKLSNHVAPYFACAMCAGTIIPCEERHAPHVHFEYSTDGVFERITPAAVTSGDVTVALTGISMSIVSGTLGVSTAL